MRLYGRDLSPYTRLVAIWCVLQQRDVERRQMAVSGPDFEKLREINPLGRVPTLVLDDGTMLVDSWAIGDWLEDTTPLGIRLIPETGTARRDVMARLALAKGVTDKAVAYVYENNRRPEELHFKDWQTRLVGQIRGGLGLLEDSTERSWPELPNAADLATAIGYQFISITNPQILEPGYPKLAAFTEAAMSLPAFAETVPPQG